MQKKILFVGSSDELERLKGIKKKLLRNGIHGKITKTDEPKTPFALVVPEGDFQKAKKILGISEQEGGE